MSAVYEKEKLAYRLLDGETAKRLERPGASLRYSVLPCAGEKVGTVIFLHGVASNGSRWEEFIEKTSLKQAFDILRCDLRGHAASVSSRQARLEDWCGDVAAILQAEGVFDINTVMAGILVLTAFALVLDWIVGFVERRAMRWQPRAGTSTTLKGGSL